MQTQMLRNSVWGSDLSFGFIEVKNMSENALNVLGEELVPCSYDPLTGYYRDGCCNTDDHDQGSHVVCAKVTQEFLDFSLTRGNDLVTPRAEYRFAGLKAGDRWCLCAMRWKEALDAGVAPPVISFLSSSSV